VHGSENRGVQDTLHLGDHDDWHGNAAVEYAIRIVDVVGAELVFGEYVLGVAGLSTGDPEPKGVENELPFCCGLLATLGSLTYTKGQDVPLRRGHA